MPVCCKLVGHLVWELFLELRLGWVTSSVSFQVWSGVGNGPSLFRVSMVAKRAYVSGKVKCFWLNA